MFAATRTHFVFASSAAPRADRLHVSVWPSAPGRRSGHTKTAFWREMPTTNRVGTSSPGKNSQRARSTMYVSLPRSSFTVSVAVVNDHSGSGRTRMNHCRSGLRTETTRSSFFTPTRSAKFWMSRRRSRSMVLGPRSPLVSLILQRLLCARCAPRKFPGQGPFLNRERNKKRRVRDIAAGTCSEVLQVPRRVPTVPSGPRSPT